MFSAHKVDILPPSSKHKHRKSIMKLSNALSLPTGLVLPLQVAFGPTAKAVFREPSLLLRWPTLSKVFMANLWVVYGDGIDGGMTDAKKALLCGSETAPKGVVLDLGAGHGHTVKYLDREKVTHFIALEPNVLMHPRIRALAQEAGFNESDGTLIILSCGAEDTNSILSTLAKSNIHSVTGAPSQPVDTMVSILTLCTLPDPERTLSALVRNVLKPGGDFLTFEHVLSHREDIAWWQRFWAPLWAVFFDGCRIDRASDVLVKSLEVDDGEGGGKRVSAWSEWKTWHRAQEEEEAGESMFIHVAGRFVKK